MVQNINSFTALDVILCESKVENLISNVEMKENLLDDLDLFNSARRDHDGTAIQAFVADCANQVRFLPVK